MPESFAVISKGPAVPKPRLRNIRHRPFSVTNQRQVELLDRSRIADLDARDYRCASGFRLWPPSDLARYPFESAKPWTADIG